MKIQIAPSNFVTHFKYWKMPKRAIEIIGLETRGIFTYYFTICKLLLSFLLSITNRFKITIFPTNLKGLKC